MTKQKSAASFIPDQNCALCPRLMAFRLENRQKYPDKFNAPVPAFGDDKAELIIVGLAPGREGANFTGRPFTNDYAGDLLYPTLQKFGFMIGDYQAHAQDGIKLLNCLITNAVKCVPPQNKPEASEINTCRSHFFKAELAHYQNAKVMIALGTIAHESILRSFEMKPAAFKFAHGAEHQIGRIRLLDSYHCSRYNTNTKRLTTKMFEDIFARARSILHSP
jgi:uracil-DNA glycosylase family 4